MNEIVIKHFLCRRARGSAVSSYRARACGGVLSSPVTARAGRTALPAPGTPAQRAQTGTVLGPFPSILRLRPASARLQRWRWCSLVCWQGCLQPAVPSAMLPRTLQARTRTFPSGRLRGCITSSSLLVELHRYEWGWIAAMIPIGHAQIFSLRPGEIMLLPLAPHQQRRFRVRADKPARPVPAAALSSRAGCDAQGSDVPAAGTRATLNCGVTQDSSRDWELTVISLSFPCWHLPTAHTFVHH